MTKKIFYLFMIKISEFSRIMPLDSTWIYLPLFFPPKHTLLK